MGNILDSGTDPVSATGAGPATPPRSFRESLLAMLGLFFVVMSVAINQTVVGTALPTIVAELKGFSLYPWVAGAYLLASIITVPIFGRLGDHFGRKYFVIASIVIFTLGSALCGMANSMLFLVLARGLQGIGSGMLIGTAFASVPDLFPEPRLRLRWGAMISAGFGIANAVGPSLGGFLTEYSGWRSVFYVNLPIGLLSVYFVARHMPLIRHRSHQDPIRLDWLGAVLIAVALGGLQLFVQLLPRHDFGFGMFALALASGAAFIGLYYCEQRASHPLLPLDMFRTPALASLFLLSILTGFVMFSLFFFVPLLLQGGFGLAPNAAGLLITPLVFCITIGSLSNGRLLTRIHNSKYVMYAGYALLCGSGIGIATLTHFTSHGVIALYMLGSGLGLGLILPNLTIFAQQAAGRAQLGIATAMIQSLRMMGGMLGTGMIGTLVSHLYVSRVHAALAASGAAPWRALLDDPQILINKVAQQQLLKQLQATGRDGAALIEMARVSLVSAIHAGQVLVVLIAVLALWQMRRVPRLRLRR